MAEAAGRRPHSLGRLQGHTGLDPEDGLTTGRGIKKDDWTYRVASELSYQFYRWLDFSCGHSYRYNDYKERDITRHANLFYVHLTFKPLRPLVIY